MTVQIGIVWNPSKTDKESLEAALTSAAAGGETPVVQWWETSKEDPGQGAAQRAIAAGAELVIVAGGDGTVRAVAEHLADTRSDADLAIVPLGTGNLFARNVDVPIGDLPAAFTRALEPDSQGIDVGWVDVDLEAGRERHAFVVLIGFGIDAHMIEETNDDLKDKAGWLAYVESLGRAFAASETVTFHIATDDQPGHDEEGHTLLVANCGTLQGGLTLLPDASPTDGELDYLALSADGFGQWADTVKSMVWDNGLKRFLTDKSESMTTESVNIGRAKKLHVTLPEARAFEIDGEEIGNARSFTVTVQPSAIRVR
ncbi:diacylglycerol/lipid kinase family protein (plasmid) [Coraliomargarita sp. W4R53]